MLIVNCKPAKVEAVISYSLDDFCRYTFQVIVKSRVQLDISQAMSSLCPSLGSTLGADQFAEMSKLLETEAKNSFSSWVDEQMSNFASSLALVTSTAPLTVLPAWDKVTIEETGDSGQQVKLEELAIFTNLKT